MTIQVSQASAAAVSRRIGGLAAAAAIALFALPDTASAQAPTLTGNWSGTGTVVFPSGEKERARCRVRYSQSSTTRYTATAVCATSSTRVEQTATLRRVGVSRFVGTFYNSEYGVSGSISVVMKGRSQTISLRGENGASASISLTR
jgi:hypothetical protein